VKSTDLWSKINLCTKSLILRRIKIFSDTLPAEIINETINETKISHTAEVPLSLPKYHTKCQSRRCPRNINECCHGTVCCYLSKEVCTSVVSDTKQFLVPRPSRKPYWLDDCTSCFSAQYSRRVHRIFPKVYACKVVGLLGLYESKNSGSFRCSHHLSLTNFQGSCPYSLFH
jgi:hypothetical protein